MREITEIKKVYKFEELSETAKEKVKQWYLDGIDVYDFERDMLENLRELGFKNSHLKVQFSLNYCQGDGFNIYGELDFNDCLEISGITETLTSEELAILKGYFEYCDTTNLMSNDRYAYCIVDSNDLFEDLAEYLKDDDIKYDNSLLDKFEKCILDYLSNLCSTYEKYGYDYFYEVSEEDLQEICDSNSYEFYENGKFYS